MPRLQIQSSIRVSFGVLVAAVFVACMIPVPEALTVFSWQDKLEHVLSFLCLAVLGMIGWPRRVGQLTTGLVLYGGLIEVAQSFTSWRSGDVLDWLADSVGVMLGLAAIVALRRPGSARSV